MSSSNTIKASVIQCSTVKYDLDATLEKMDRLVKVARGRDGSQLAVFPEAFIGGYPKGLTFGCTIGERDPAGRDDFLAYAKSAITIPGPAVSRVEAIAREHGVFIVSGVIEKDGGTLYCSVIWVHPEHGLVGKRRKLMPTASERLVWGFGDETDVKVCTTTLPHHEEPITLSSNICWENYMPLLRYRIYELGTQLYCAPTVDGREVWGSTMRHVAVEGRCFVLAACQISHRFLFSPRLRLTCPCGLYFSQAKDHVSSVKDALDSKTQDDDEETKIAGGSVIIDPLGTILAGPLRGSEGVLTAELDLDTITRGKFDLDVVGHYARKDIFSLNVRET
ncbi:Nitrilase [Naganishia albida]|nr:Nitrilase [Naganishia albida]